LLSASVLDRFQFDATLENLVASVCAPCSKPKRLFRSVLDVSLEISSGSHQTENRSRHCLRLFTPANVSIEKKNGREAIAGAAHSQLGRDVVTCRLFSALPLLASVP
jgi:hypothetical protein